MLFVSTIDLPGEIDLANKYFYIPHPKEKKFKSVPILDKDVAIIRQIGLSFPAMPFFRHNGGIKGTSPNEPFGIKYFYKWWKQACLNLGIKGVDLYGGTRHSTVTDLGKKYSPETIKQKGTGHKTNKAFDRYLYIQDDEARELYAHALPSPNNFATILQPKKKPSKNGKLLEL